jgi:hypothetical protein
MVNGAENRGPLTVRTRLTSGRSAQAHIMPVTLIIELGQQTPPLGYRVAPSPEGGYTRQLNLGLVGLTWFSGSILSLIDQWRRLVRREVWRAETGRPPGDDAGVL